MDIFQPPPLYPPLVSRPLNLDNNDFYQSQLKIKKNFRTLIQDSFFYIEPKLAGDKKNDFDSTIERYSDRYSKSKKTDLSKFKPNWSRLPKELKHFYEKEAKTKKLKRKQVAPTLVKRKVKRIIDDDDIDKLVEIIAKDDQEEENQEDEVEDKEAKKEKPSDDEEKEDDLEGDEDDFEEENDYIDNYFDNGENDGDDDGGGDDEGPVY